VPSTRRKLDGTLIDVLLCNVRVPSEFSRTGVLHGDINAEQYRNLALYFFPLLTEAFTEMYITEPQDNRVILLWVLFAFVMRAYYAGQEEYEALSKTMLL